MKKNTLFLVLRVCSYLPVLQCTAYVASAQKASRSICSVYFATDKYDLTTESKAKLDSLVKQVSLSVDYALDITANTDADGTSAYNDVLSWNRARSVELYLLSKDVVINKMRAKGLGKNYPLYDNSTEVGKAGNRRVDIDAVIYTFENIDQVMDAVSAKSEQHFIIDAAKQSVINGRNGTLITIPANAFVTGDGATVKGNVDFEIKEALNTTDIVLANLSTTSNDKLLQTGGMVYIQATSDGKKIELAKSKSITVTIPTKQKTNGMQLFYGEKTATGAINWIPTGQKPKSTQLAIDVTKLKNIKMPTIVKPQALSFKGLPKRPHYPAPPAKPYEPREPDALIYKPGFLVRLFCSRENIAHREDRLNQPRTDEYDKRMERYAKNMERYTLDMWHYKYVTLPKYYDDSAAYFQTLKHRAVLVNNYIDAYSTYIACRELKESVNKYVNTSITPGTRFILPNKVEQVNNLNCHDLVEEYIGNENVSYWDRYFDQYRMSYIDNDAFNYPDYYSSPEVLIDGSTVATNFNALVYVKIYALADSLGITKLMSEYDREIFQASARAGATPDEFIDKYIFTVSRLSWINCDHFLDNPNPVRVKVNEPEDAKVLIVCNSINSYLAADKQDNYYLSSNLPANTPITIVAVKIKHGQLQMATQKSLAGEQPVYDLHYTACNLAQLREQLKLTE